MREIVSSTPIGANQGLKIAEEKVMPF